MDDLSLHVRKKDWFLILLTSTILSSILSAFVYALLPLPLLHGVLFGALLGSTVTVFSLSFITLMNKAILPKLKRSYWIITAAFFSFLSGFLGTLCTFYFADLGALISPAPLHQNPFYSAVFFGIITYAFGFLLYRFVTMRNYKEHTDNLLLQSRLTSLETQLNPHFLFNALNSLTELLHVNPKKAEETLLRLSMFLRDTMKEKALITLQEELSNTQNYLAIENIRFADAIKFELLVPPRHLTWSVPKFSIQLLVENAIKHGFKKAPFVINVQTQEKNDQRFIHVQNNGTPVQKNAFGIGLSNLNERLAYLCQGEVLETSSYLTQFTIVLGTPYETFDRR